MISGTKKTLIAAAILGCAGALTQAPALAADAMMMNPNEIKWGDPPPQLPKGATIIQISGNGPFDITYINPADDPLKGK